MLETLRADQERRRRESEAAYTELQRNVGQVGQNVGQSPKREPRLSFVNQKHYEGGKFLGNKNENFKVWAKRVRIYCNSQVPGMRRALELTEAHARPVDVHVDQLELGSASLAQEADSRLHDFLATFTGEEALRIVDVHPDQGFEAWRQLKIRYNPDGGRMELYRIESLFSKKPCRTLGEVPAAIDVLERDLRRYEANGNSLPNDVKISMLCRIMPDNQRNELESRFRMGERDYHKMLDMVMQFSNEFRLMEGRGQKDMDVDSAEQSHAEAPKYTVEEWEAWQAVELDYMGKGKGGKGGKGKSKGKGKGGKGKGKETRTCHHCQKVGHLIEDCRAKAAGKPKVKSGANAASVDEETWEDDLPTDGLSCDSFEL